MTFQEHPWHGDESFPSHHRVLQYLQDYSQRFQLLDNIQFNTQVTKVSLLWHEKKSCVSPIQEDWPKILVQSKRENGPIEKEVFDAVLIAIGHYSQPWIPNIPGIQAFQGKVLHSKD
jgi:cation diffusion facilitator CzcD-associated flavoprotein CzcO